MVTKIYLIRHGETEDADEKRYKGHIDVPLSKNGIEQIKRVAKFVSGEAGKRGCSVGAGCPRPDDLKAVYCSGLSRAVKSAEIIAEPFGIRPVIVEELKERNFGAWEGMSFDEIRDKYPGAFGAWADNPLRFSPMGGESTIDVSERAVKIFDELAGRHEGESIAIVAHGGINRVILCELLGIPLENIFRIEQDYAAINVIEKWDYPVIKHLNMVV